MIGSWAKCSMPRSWAVSSKPSMPGISMSVTTQSKLLLAEQRQGLLGVARPPTTSKPASSSRRRSISRVTSESSTRSTRTRRDGRAPRRAPGSGPQVLALREHGGREHPHRLARGEEGHALEQPVGGDGAPGRSGRTSTSCSPSTSSTARASGWPETMPSSRSWRSAAGWP